MTALSDILTTYKKSPSCAANGLATHGALGTAEAALLSERRSAWQRLIDEKLIEWGRHPEQFEDEDGYKAPSPDNLVRATEFVWFCREKDLAPPLRMVPDGEGGIVFDWRNSPSHTVARIHADGGMEILVFHDSRLVLRERIGAEIAV